MKKVTSKDGTAIAFDQLGDGPALILVGGTLEHRALDTDIAKLAALSLLAQHSPGRKNPRTVKSR
jgi:hypothetical protein